MKTETIEKVKALVKEVLLEIKENNYDQMFHEMLFHCRYTSTDAPHPPSTTTFSIGEVKYSLYPTMFHGYGIEIKTVHNNVDYEIARILYTEDDFRVDNFIQKCNTHYTNLLGDASAQVGILIDFI